MDFAKRAAVDAAKLLHRGDQVGVVSFGNRGKGRVVVPLTDVARWRDIRKAVSGLTHEFEETYAADALGKAIALLQRSSAPVKHVVVITDGEIMDTTDTGEFRALKAAARARQAGCTVSVIQVVPQDRPAGSEMVRSAPAKRLSDAGGGILARGRSADVIPVVVSTEVRRTLERAEHGPNTPDKPKTDREPKKPAEPPTRKPDRPKPPEPAPKPGGMKVRAVSDSPLLLPTPDAGYPDLFGILPVRGRADAQVLLVAGAEGVPLLAFANRGLGRIGVWTADLLGGWGREWRQAEAFPAWLAQWVQHLAPALPASPPEVLRELQLSPPAPLPQEVAALLDLTDGRVCQLSEYPQPEPRHRDRVFGLAPDHALFGLLALLILLLSEFLWRATGMRRKITTGP